MNPIIKKNGRIQKIFVSFFLAAQILYLLGCSRPASQTFPRWQYVAFKLEGDPQALIWSADRIEPEMPGSEQKPYPIENLAGLLNFIGRDGWELAWTDGTNYLVKRAIPHDIAERSPWHYEGFYLTQKP